MIAVTSVYGQQATTMITDSMKSFSSAIKGGKIEANVEPLMFSYNEGALVLLQNNGILAVSMKKQL